ncbi:hypothetical protein CRE_00326 [Caenorhabditis remanei]|uniref:Uncharacterized protein n=1 Tax=Caenorhabditis remanei TaxID=31234 RepID=E3LEI6_CAERE|nr:hypothetical protein CRE_00326 [Caenorhabditis remanei]
MILFKLVLILAFLGSPIKGSIGKPKSDHLTTAKSPIVHTNLEHFLYMVENSEISMDQKDVEVLKAMVSTPSTPKHRELLTQYLIFVTVIVTVVVVFLYTKRLILEVRLLKANRKQKTKLSELPFIRWFKRQRKDDLDSGMNVTYVNSVYQDV